MLGALGQPLWLLSKLVELSFAIGAAETGESELVGLPCSLGCSHAASRRTDGSASKSRAVRSCSVLTRYDSSGFPFSTAGKRGVRHLKSADRTNTNLQELGLLNTEKHASMDSLRLNNCSTRRRPVYDCAGVAFTDYRVHKVMPASATTTSAMRYVSERDFTL